MHSRAAGAGVVRSSRYGRLPVREPRSARTGSTSGRRFLHRRRPPATLRNQASWKVHAGAVPGQGLEIGTPWHRGLKGKAKGEILRCHHLMSGPEGRLVVGARRPEPQGPRSLAASGRLPHFMPGHRVRLATACPAEPLVSPRMRAARGHPPDISDSPSDELMRLDGAGPPPVHSPCPGRCPGATFSPAKSGEIPALSRNGGPLRGRARSPGCNAGVTGPRTKGGASGAGTPAAGPASSLNCRRTCPWRPRSHRLRRPART